MNYDMPLARNSDPITSHAAADACAGLRSRDKRLILGTLKRCGPMGKDAIAGHVGLTGVAVARRLPELERLGLVRATGKTVLSDTGRAEREWEAV
jgi:predicted ArsR family transcriptional regulator